MLLSNRVAMITGGAKGIGRAIASKFAEEGCSIAIADIDITPVKEKDILAIQCDATNGQQVKDAVEMVISKYGKIDILVNNAGGMSAAPPLDDLDEETWDGVVDLNLKSNYLFSKAVTPYMKEKRYGRVISISSVGAINPPKHSIHYNSAKAGVLGFTYDLAYALAPYNINVNAILPGLIQTEFYDQIASLTTEEQKKAFFTQLGQMVPLKRIGTPEDIAGAALFLASELGSYVTGTSILVTGGLPLNPQNT